MRYKEKKKKNVLTRPPAAITCLLCSPAPRNPLKDSLIFNTIMLYMLKVLHVDYLLTWVGCPDQVLSDSTFIRKIKYEMYLKLIKMLLHLGLCFYFFSQKTSFCKLKFKISFFHINHIEVFWKFLTAIWPLFGRVWRITLHLKLYQTIPWVQSFWTFPYCI